MALTGNDIIVSGGFTELTLRDSHDNIIHPFISIGSGGSNYGSIHYNEPIYIGAHSVYLGDILIDTQETYHLYFSMPYGAMSFSTWGVMGNQGYTTPGPAYTQGFGVYFTTWDDLHDNTIGEVAFTNSTDPLTGPLQIDYNNPGTLSSFNTFCPETDATGDLSTLKLFIDFGLGNPYYQYVYYAAGDPGF